MSADADRHNDVKVLEVNANRNRVRREQGELTPSHKYDPRNGVINEYECRKAYKDSSTLSLKEMVSAFHFIK